MNRFSDRYSFSVPERKRIRLIIDTDAKNEADDQYAVVHALLTPKFDVRGIIGAHFGEEKSKTSMEDSCREVEHLLRLMGIGGAVPVWRGAPRAMQNERDPVPSQGSAGIIREALSGDKRPLFCIFLGPITDMASALLEEPRIAGKVTAVWIGGGPWPRGGGEYNLHNDIPAANAVLASDAALWQVPRDVYSMVKVSLAELQAKVKPCGAVGQYLFDQLTAVNDQYADNPEWPAGESWVLGDSPAVGLLLDEHGFCYRERIAPRIGEAMRYVHPRRGRKIRVYERIETRFLLEDFFCKLAICCGGAENTK